MSNFELFKHKIKYSLIVEEDLTEHEMEEMFLNYSKSNHLNVLHWLYNQPNHPNIKDKTASYLIKNWTRSEDKTIREFSELDFNDPMITITYVKFSEGDEYPIMQVAEEDPVNRTLHFKTYKCPLVFAEYQMNKHPRTVQEVLGTNKEPDEAINRISYLVEVNKRQHAKKTN